MRKIIEYIIVKIDPQDFPIVETKDQENEYRDKVVKEIKEALPKNEIEVKLCWKHLK